MADLFPVAAPISPCKVCGNAAPLFGVCDFNRNCEESRGRVLPMSGIPIYYHQCPKCGFLFTNAFDGFSSDDFRKWIYNDQYASIDLDYAVVRPGNNTAIVYDRVGPAWNTRILDYGSGNGVLAKNLRQRGYTDVVEYDPFVPHASRRPDGLFECITAFEVIEHSTDPLGTIRDILSLLADPGAIFFTTFVRNAQIIAAGMAWPYIAPRNGHASIFTQLSLQTLADNLQLRFGSFNDVNHVLLRHVPPFFAHRVTLSP